MLLEIISGNKLNEAFVSKEKKLKISNKILRTYLLLKDQNKKDYFDSYLIEIDQGSVGSRSFSDDKTIIEIENDEIYVTAILRKWKMPVYDIEVEKEIIIDGIFYYIDIGNEYFEFEKANEYINNIIAKEENNEINFESARECINYVLFFMDPEEYKKYSIIKKEILQKYRILKRWSIIGSI